MDLSSYPPPTGPSQTPAYPQPPQPQAWLPPPPPPPPWPAAPKQKHWPRLVAAGAVAAALVVVAVFLARRGDHDRYPSAWDDRVLDLVHFVEDNRGHDFEHPVPVLFLTPEEYTARTRTDSATQTEEDRAATEQQEGEYRSLGLIGPDVDLFEAGNDLVDAGTLAFYDPATEEVVVRGSDLTADLRVTLVHELTHTLQDQVFGVDGQLGKDPTSGQLFAQRAMLEGDAVRIERIYYDSLSADEQQQADDALEEGLDVLAEEDIPGPLQAFFGAPYALGDGLLSVLDAEGADAVDDAFRDLPTTEENVLDPFSYLAGEGAASVAEVAAPAGADEPFEEGDFGAASLFVVLSEDVDPRQALAAVLGWGGDAYVAYEQDDLVCVDLDVTGDTPADTAELESTIAAWVAAQPAEAGASTVRTADVVRLHTCDPGAAAAPPTGASYDALSLPAVRSLAAANVLAGGGPQEVATCFGDGLVAQLTTDELAATDITPDLQAKIDQIAAACTAPG